MNADKKDMDITLPILQAVEECQHITQRSLSQRLGLALGLTNSYLKNCIKKGLIKIEQVPANRYLYFLTPKGFAEKGRLTAQKMYHSFHFYRSASESCARVMQMLVGSHNSVILCGVSELAEIAVMQAMHLNIAIDAILDMKTEHKSFLDFPVYYSTEEMPEQSMCVVTHLKNPEWMVEVLSKRFSPEQIIVPDLLH